GPGQWWGGSWRADRASSTGRAGARTENRGSARRPRSAQLPDPLQRPTLRSAATIRAGAARVRNSSVATDDKAQGGQVPLAENPLAWPRFGAKMCVESWSGEAGPTLPR